MSNVKSESLSWSRHPSVTGNLGAIHFFIKTSKFWVVAGCS